MKPEDKIRKIVKRADLSINSDADENVYQDIFKARQKITNNIPATPVNIWRIIMKNPLSKIVAAAAVIIACIAGLTMFNKTSGIAIADVLRNMEEINAYKYQHKIHSNNQFENERYDEHFEWIIQREILISKDYGVKIISSVFDNNKKEITNKTEEYCFQGYKPYFRIDHLAKSYRQLEFDETLLQLNADAYTDPYELVENFLKDGYKNLGISTIDGNEVEVFQINEKTETNGSETKSSGTKLYVDVKTQLPVKIESNAHTEDHDATVWFSDIQQIRDGFEWNVSVTAADFEPIIPDGYTNTTTTDMGGRGGMMGGAGGQ